MPISAISGAARAVFNCGGLEALALTGESLMNWLYGPAVICMTWFAITGNKRVVCERVSVCPFVTKMK